MKKTALLLMFFSVIMKLLGFSREILISYYYGASDISDAYLIALTIPGTIFTIVGAGIITGFIPMYSRIESEENVIAADHFTSDFINFVMLCCIFLVLGISLFTKPIVHLFAFGFQGEVLKLSLTFTRICAFSVFFTGMVSVYNGYLQVKRRFLLPVLISIPFNICIIVSILLSYRYDIRLLAYGSVVAELAQFLFLLPFLYHIGYRYRLSVDWRNRYLKQIIRLSMPIILGVSINQINILIDKTIASKLMVGGISALNYAGKLSGTIQGIFIASVVAVLFPVMSHLAAQDKLDEMKKYLQRSILVIHLFLLPATIGMMIFAKQIVILLYGRGAFDTEAIQITSVSFLCYSIGMLGIGLREILSRAFYSLQNTKVPMINALIGILINIILNFILSQYMGIAGLALATSISASVTTLLLYTALRGRIGAFIQKEGYLDMGKLIIASALMGIFARVCFHQLSLSFSPNYALIMAVCLGGIFYFVLLQFFRVSYAKELWDTVMNRSRRNKGSEKIIEERVGEEEVEKEIINPEIKNPENKNSEEINSEIKDLEEINSREINSEIKISKEINSENKNLEQVIDRKQAYHRTVESTNSNRNAVRNQRMTSLLGIIVVTDQNPEGLRRILEQIRRQTLHPYQVFIIDVGTNEPGDMIYDYLRRNSQFYYCRLTAETGHAGGFYYGMTIAYEQGATFVWCLEDYMNLHPYALQALWIEIRKRSDRACLISNEIEDFERRRILELRYKENSVYPVIIESFNGVMLPCNMIEEIRVPDEKMYHGFDEIKFFRQIIEKGYTTDRVRDSLITDPNRSYPER